MAAWLCRRHTLATLSEIAAGLGLSRADSVPCLVRRLETRLKTSAHLVRDVEGIVQILSRRTIQDVALARRPERKTVQ